MDTIYYYIIGAAVSLVAVVILLVFLYRFRRRETEKDHMYIRKIRELDRVSRELHRTRIEKDAYEELLKKKMMDDESGIINDNIE